MKLKSVQVTEGSLSMYDVVVLCTDHDDFDYQLIEQEAKLIIDTRGKFNRNINKVIKA